MRELADRIDRYLDRDRKLEHRRELAAEQLALAREALAGGPERRADAVYAAGRALALDPDSEAADVLRSLLVAPPVDLPRDLVADVEREEAAAQTRWLRRVAWGWGALLAGLAPAALLLPVRSWPLLVAHWASIGGAMLHARFARRFDRPWWIGAAIVMFVLAFLAAETTPFIVTPLFTVVAGTILVANPPWVNGPAWRPVVVALMLGLASLLPQWLGAIDRTWRQTEAGIVIASQVYDTSGPIAVYALVAGILLALVGVAVFVHASVRDEWIADHDLRASTGTSIS